ncbi:hypothetical protein ACH4UM_23705 [Streptomyces sp. NPDC020801]|uniref:hypothetical protein n=1 Tax=Streptomyces sp. NPDC020801 TaxID=3365093 RepID=UPI0037A36F3E
MTAACIAEHCTRLLRDWETSANWQICRPCVDQMRAWLRAVPNLLIVLADGSMHRERSGESGGRGGTKEAPLPGRPTTMNFIGPASTTDVRDLHGDQIGQRPIIDFLGSWTRLVLEEHPRRHQRDFKQPDNWSEAGLSAWLSTALPWASTMAWIGEMAQELRDLTIAIRGIARVEVRTRAVSRPCPNSDCGLLALTRTDWDQYVRCSACGNAYTDAELNADAVARSAA